MLNHNKDASLPTPPKSREKKPSTLSLATKLFGISKCNAASAAIRQVELRMPMSLHELFNVIQFVETDPLNPYNVPLETTKLTSCFSA